jgi:hypothetical protein
MHQLITFHVHNPTIWLQARVQHMNRTIDHVCILVSDGKLVYVERFANPR